MRVAVVGGGFAGLAAAITLQERRHDVVLLERRGVLGGRATSFRDAVTGEATIALSGDGLAAPEVALAPSRLQPTPLEFRLYYDI